MAFVVSINPCRWLWRRIIICFRSGQEHGSVHGNDAESFHPLSTTKLIVAYRRGGLKERLQRLACRWRQAFINIMNRPCFIFFCLLYCLSSFSFPLSCLFGNKPLLLLLLNLENVMIKQSWCCCTLLFTVSFCSQAWTLFDPPSLLQLCMK